MVVYTQVNPFRRLPVYGPDEEAAASSGAESGDDSQRPHVFGVAARALVALRTGGKNQSVIITGESGAGKTEATKYVLQYIVVREARLSGLMY